MPWIAFEPLSVEQRVTLIEQWERDWRAGGDVVLGVFLDGVVVGSSARVPEKLGFTYTGNADVPIAAPSETGSHRVYRMTRSDWAGRG